VKCIVLHGGQIFSAGNDVEAFEIGREDVSFIDKMVKEMIRTSLNRLMESLLNLEKPLIALVSGFAVGIGFTMLSMADFVYCTPEAKFLTPFMQSFQSPEGASSFKFPEIFGPHKANEMILLDKPLTAKEAQQFGFVNQVLTDFKKSEWPDLF
jgi:Delta3-Delta2-enoyl-CoA isomerase